MFGQWALPNPIGKVEWLATVTRVVHITTSYILLIIVGSHVGLGLKHHLFDRDGFLYRMLPFVRR